MRALSIILCLLSFSVAYAADNKIEEMDSVLDRLERKLIDQEANTLRIEPIPTRSATTQRIKMPTGSIQATMPQDNDFKGLEQQISRLEKEADELSGQIETLKSDFMDKAAQGSLVEIAALIQDPDQTAIRELSVTLDKSKIYSMSAGDIPWMPGKQLSIFLGPLEPGEHTLQLEGRTVRRPDKGLPLDMNVYHQYNQEFKIQVPTGKVHKGYRFVISRPEQQNTRAQAVLEAYDLQ